MITSVLITAVSFLLLLFWCRYTCLLLLNASPAAKQAEAVAHANRLGFLEVQKALTVAPAQAALEGLYCSLETDYRILIYLLEHSTGLDVSAVERKMLVLDYKIMRLLFRVARHKSTSHAKTALMEMSQVLGYFSQKVGEHVAQYAAAA